MKTPLACLNLLHGKTRTLVAIAGVSFSVLLIFMQLGFLGSVRQTATAIYDALEFDIMIRSPGYRRHLVGGPFAHRQPVRQHLERRLATALGERRRHGGGTVHHRIHDGTPFAVPCDGSAPADTIQAGGFGAGEAGSGRGRGSCGNRGSLLDL